MRRQIVLDTETTGLDPAQGHRLIEIGCIELMDRALTGNHFHYYLNPQRDIDPGAQAVHGITREFLQDKPTFDQIYQPLLAYLAGAELIIHNAPFDLGFLNHELNLLDIHVTPIEQSCSITDTLVMARQRHPGQKNNLDALCKRYQVDNSARQLHGALLDAEILADVYLRMTGGQTTLFSEPQAAHEMAHASQAKPTVTLDTSRAPLKILRANTQELTAHEDFLTQITSA
ncbi:MAG: DNA polymerase III subunit epsilon [Legionellales bacterium]|nr:DNA polymerase III subunit epsilon [Legionellales bacterium]